MLANIINVVPEVILKDLPLGDPEQSDGDYKKLKSTLKVNIDQFFKLKEGLRATIDLMTIIGFIFFFPTKNKNIKVERICNV